MLDIHSHILPGVDDGSNSMEESIEMAKIYLDNGINKLIATPHYIEGIENKCKDENQVVLEQLREELLKNGLDLDVYLGNEIYTTMDMISYLEEGKVSTLNDSKYILMEFPMFDIPLYVENLIYELLLKGYVPIIAHPERNKNIIDDPNILYGFIEKGALAQLNLPSIQGKYGRSIKDTGEILLKHNMIHFVGTDAHSKNKRSPNVKSSLEMLKTLVDSEDYEKLTYLNGLNVLNNRDVVIESPIRYEKSKNLFYVLKSKLNIF